MFASSLNAERASDAGVTKQVISIQITMRKQKCKFGALYKKYLKLHREFVALQGSRKPQKIIQSASQQPTKF